MAWETHIAPQSHGTRMGTDVGSTDRLGENPKRQPQSGRAPQDCGGAGMTGSDKGPQKGFVYDGGWGEDSNPATLGCYKASSAQGRGSLHPSSWSWQRG